MVTEKYLRSINREFCVFYFQDLLKVSVAVIQEKKVLNRDLAVFLDKGERAYFLVLLGISVLKTEQTCSVIENY
jgi:hypothetical protein